jgi:hypothetical protein
VVALQQRAVAPALRAVVPMTAQNAVQTREPLSYTVPTAASGAASAEETPPMLPAARLTSYVFAHSRYSSVLGQSNVLSGLLTEADDQAPASPNGGTVSPATVSHTAGSDASASQAPRDPRIAP